MNYTMGWTVNNKEKLYIGGTPNKIKECNFNYYIDEIRFYSRELKGYEIEAEVGTGGGGVEPSYVQVGCTKCELVNAPKSCADGYHLCTSNELNTGAFHFARTQGFVDYSTHLWSNDHLLSYNQGQESDMLVNDLGTALCCSDLI